MVPGKGGESPGLELSITLEIYYQRAMEWLRMEKPSKISESHHSPALPGPPVTPVPKGHLYMGSEQLQGWSPHPFPGQLCQCLTTLQVTKLFPVSDVNLPWHNLKPFPLILGIFFPLRVSQQLSP